MIFYIAVHIPGTGKLNKTAGDDYDKLSKNKTKINIEE